MNTLDIYYQIKNQHIKTGLHLHKKINHDYPRDYDPHYLSGLISVISKESSYEINDPGVPFYVAVEMLSEYSKNLSLHDYMRMMDDLHTMNDDVWKGVTCLNIEFLDKVDFKSYCEPKIKQILSTKKIADYKTAAFIHIAKKHHLINNEQLSHTEILDDLLLYDNPTAEYNNNKSIYQNAILRSTQRDSYQLTYFLDKFEKLEIDNALLQEYDIINYRFKACFKTKRNRYMDVPDSIIPFLTSDYWIYAFYSEISSYSTMMNLLTSFEKIKPYIGEHAQTLYQGLSVIADTIGLHQFNTTFSSVFSQSIIRNVQELKDKLKEYCPDTLTQSFNKAKELSSMIGVTYDEYDAILEFGTTIHQKTKYAMMECDIHIF